MWPQTASVERGVLLLLWWSTFFFLLANLRAAVVQADKVCVVGCGTIGASFAAVFLAAGHEVVCCDAFVDPSTVQERIENIWPTLKLRGMATSKSPPSKRQLSFENSLTEAVQSVDFVQECVYEDVELKQQVLKKLDEAVESSVLVASSTSYIPLDLLTAKCHSGTKNRILIAHPSIPHWGSFMELCGSSDRHVQAAKDWYTRTGCFDCIIMKKSIFGHVWNSFLTLNLQHGESLIKQGVCSAEDVNTVLRHLGREFYGRHLFLTLLIAIGGDQGLKGGLTLRERVADSAISILMASNFRWLPGARRLGQTISKVLRPIVVKPVDPAWLEACQRYEKMMKNDGSVDIQTGMLDFCREMYTRLPLEVNRDPLSFSKKT
mmetsp:Transcript_26037/g.61806  ORF Transcript_26037/g.61806 Transcript_26037/m.61806 type:complete len:377 (-) Transcript_26037:1676-2806(-)